jgi:intracellular sulfur oxidation DsrE/DsrF family protein
MNNIRNHPDADPTAKIVVVAHGPGIEFLLEGAKDTKGQPYGRAAIPSETGPARR